ncbi:MAG TPA: hypothetical protein VND21_07370 [Planctomycetota bacterium]|nr:hypothetical protein [Planctomycetota bacterium]
MPSEHRHQMPREQSDLLDVFRGKPARSSGARAVSRPVADRRKGEVVVSRRQIALGGAVTGLLVLLAFMGGTAVGRHRGAGVPLANRPAAAPPATPVYQFRSKELSRLSAEGGDLQTRALQSFTSAFPRLAQGLSVIPAEDAKGKVKPGVFRLMVRGFPNRTEATQWLFQVKGWQVEGFAPFEDSRPEPAP